MYVSPKKKRKHLIITLSKDRTVAGQKTLTLSWNIFIFQVTLPFNNLEEMVAQDEVPFILMGGSVVYNVFKV